VILDKERIMDWQTFKEYSRRVIEYGRQRLEYIDLNKFAGGVILFFAILLFITAKSMTDTRVISGAVLVIAAVVIILRSYVRKENG
jgi:uncharacterized membrane protein